MTLEYEEYAPPSIAAHMRRSCKILPHVAPLATNAITLSIALRTLAMSRDFTEKGTQQRSRGPDTAFN